MTTIQTFLNSLSVMGYGMLGVFLVIGSIILVVKLLDKFFPFKTEK